MVRGQTTQTYQLNKRQSIAVASRLNTALLNLARRHLDTVDVCKVVDSVADIFERQAKERQLRTAENRAKAESVVKALVPEQEIEPETPPEPKKPEPQARDLAVAGA